MSNFHLKDKRLTLKAKGLLSQILSLPENWDYTLKGLAHINLEKVSAISTAVAELEKAGYITRSRERNERGHLLGAIYIIYEEPPENIEPVSENANSEEPISENQALDNPAQDSPTLEDSMQLNTKKSNNNKTNTDLINNKSSLSSPSPAEGAKKQNEIERAEKVRNDVAGQIGYGFLKQDYPKETLVDTMFKLIVEIMLSTRDHWFIGGEKVPTYELQLRVKDINHDMVLNVIDNFLKRGTKIEKPKAYLVKCLYDEPLTHAASEANYVRVEGVACADGIKGEGGDLRA